MRSKVSSIESVIINNNLFGSSLVKGDFPKKIDNRLSNMNKQKKFLKSRNSFSAQKKNRTDVFLCQNFLAKKPSIFSGKNLSTPNVMRYIDSAMKLQQNAYEAAIMTNGVYEVQLLLIFLEAFISIIFNFYYMISVIVEPSAFKLPKVESIGYLSQHLIQPCLCVFVIVSGFALVKKNFGKSQKIVNKIIIHSPDNEIRARFLAFSQQIQSNVPLFSIFGFFSLDGSVIFSMISATTTYLIILVQTLGSQSKVDPILSANAYKLNESSKESLKN